MLLAVTMTTEPTHNSHDIMGMRKSDTFVAETKCKHSRNVDKIFLYKSVHSVDTSVDVDELGSEASRWLGEFVHDSWILSPEVEACVVPSAKSFAL